jgi:hypothetical protein
MKLVEFAFKYGTMLSEEQLKKFMAITGDDRKSFVSDKKEPTPEGLIEVESWNRHSADFDEIYALGVSVEIKFDAKVTSDGYLEIRHYLKSVEERLKEIQSAVTFNTAQSFNDRLSIRISDNLLLSMKEVKVCNDFCTDSLQEELNNGWRIIAVCHQPDQRRPDYVIGK